LIYVASGEGLHRPDLSVGDGIYRSADAGKTWTHLGLRDGQQIPALVVDPSNPNRLFAAVHPYGPNAERGIFRSQDGGKTGEKALAAKFSMSIYGVNLTELNDRTLKKAMNAVPENSVILFEDIDCMKAANRRSESDAWKKELVPAKDGSQNAGSDLGGVTLSGLLNVLDGFHAPENVIFVMTTNEMEALDPALLRAGRIDYRLFMGEAAESQKAELYCRFFPYATEIEAREFAESHSVETMAEFQGLLLALEQESTILETASICGGRNGREHDFSCSLDTLISQVCYQSFCSTEQSRIPFHRLGRSGTNQGELRMCRV
jgi:hypothetical protein